MKFGGTGPVDFNEYISYETLCANWYHLYNLKNVKNTHGGAFLLAKLQANICKLVFLGVFLLSFHILCLGGIDLLHFFSYARTTFSVLFD